MSDVPETPAPLPQTMAQRVRVLWLARGFVALVCLSLLAIDVWQSVDAYNVHLRNVVKETSNEALSVAQQAEDTIKEADTVLIGLVERLETDGVNPGNRERLHELLMTHVAELPKLHGLFVYDENGRWLVNSNRFVSRNVNNADRDYFIHHRTHPGREPFIGQPIRSRSTGDWIITVSRRLNHADGRFAGVVLATLRMAYFSHVYDSYRIGRNGTIVLARADGTLLVRRPLLEEKIGASLKNGPLFQELLPKAPAGWYMNPQSMIDGQNRLIVYRRLETYPLVAIVSKTKEELFTAFWTRTSLHLLVIGVLLLSLGSLGFLLIRHIQRRLMAEQELNDMQETLRQRNRELEKMAMQDGLTGLANRRQFDLALDEEFNRALRSNSSLALVMIDVDSFKQFNDCYGHPAGDDCLRKISAVVKSCQKRAGDLAARYGGEEIAVLLPETDIAGALTVAEMIRQGVRDLQISHAADPGGVITVSCGVDALVPIRNQHIAFDLLQGADKALYRAKSSGRDHVIAAPTYSA